MADAELESLDEMEARHKRELRELEGKVRAMLKSTKKAEKAVVEAQTIQMQYDLKAKHNEELDALSEKLGEPAKVASGPDPEEERRREEELAAAKKAKAQKKREKKTQKESERELKKEEIDANAGPCMREMELSRLKELLAKQSLTIKEIPSDGHCLYRAVADQLESLWLVESGKDKAGGDHAKHHHHAATHAADKTPDFVALRGLAAKYLRDHTEDCCPFLGMLPSDPEFKEYCDKVESVAAAEWGGQLEIRALCETLGRKIMIYAADGPVVEMGEDSSSSGSGLQPLRLAYHRHYYALGEHYNSVVPITESCSCGLEA